MPNKTRRPRSRTAKSKLELKVDYETLSTYRETPVSGSLAGVNAHGQVAIRFYTEHAVLPRTTTQAVGPGGKVEQPADFGNGLHVVRTLHLGAVMSMGQAESLAALLLRKVAERREQDKLRKATSPEGEAGE